MKFINFNNIRPKWAWYVWGGTSLINFSTSYIAFSLNLSYEEKLKTISNVYLDNRLILLISLNIFSSLCCLIIAYLYVKIRTQDKQNQQRLQLMSQTLIDLQEKERISIARDIHDDLAQNVAALNLNLHHLKSKCDISDVKIYEAFQTFKSCIDNLSRKISHIISELRTPDYQNQNFRETISDLIGEYEAIFNIKIKTYFNFNQDIQDRFTRENLYKSIKEALNNVCKHSKANHIKIFITENSGMLQTIVEDNGVGFIQKENNDTHGLKGMKERVELLNGSLQIISKKGIGTRIIIAFPVGQL